MMKMTRIREEKGQAIVMLLFFMVIAITVSSAAVVLTIVNSLSSDKYLEGNLTYYIAESGMENALLRLLRNPSYAGETLPVDGGQAKVEITGTTTKTIISEGKLGKYSRKIQVITNYNNNVLTIQSWKELF